MKDTRYDNSLYTKNVQLMSVTHVFVTMQTYLIVDRRLFVLKIITFNLTFDTN